MTALKNLKQQETQRLKKLYPHVPEYALVVPKFSDKSNKELLKCIIAFCKIENLKYETITSSKKLTSKRSKKDVIGRERLIGNDTYSKSTTKKDEPDLTIVINNRTWEIEINTKSKASKNGRHIIINSLEQFIQWHTQI